MEAPSRHPSPVNDGAGVQNEAAHLDPLFLSEREHQAQDLGFPPDLLPSATTPTQTYTALHCYRKDPYQGDHSITSSPDPYPGLPRTVATPSESYSFITRR